MSLMALPVALILALLCACGGNNAAQIAQDNTAQVTQDNAAESEQPEKARIYRRGKQSWTD